MRSIKGAVCCGHSRLGSLVQDNNFIRSGYRLGHSSYDVACSLFSWHNETGNIHTHLWGFLLFLVLTFVAAWQSPAPFQLGSAAAAHVRCVTFTACCMF